MSDLFSLHPIIITSPHSWCVSARAASFLRYREKKAIEISDKKRRWEGKSSWTTDHEQYFSVPKVLQLPLLLIQTYCCRTIPESRRNSFIPSDTQTTAKVATKWKLIYFNVSGEWRKKVRSWRRWGNSTLSGCGCGLEKRWGEKQFRKDSGNEEW